MNIEGTASADFLFGSNVADTINSGYGPDTIYGGAGDDLLVGDSSVPERGLVNRSPNDAGDYINGGPGNDIIWGDRQEIPSYYGSADTLHGGSGNDMIYGGAGNDLLYGDKGDNQLTGNFGADTFFIDRSRGVTTITDFSSEQGDHISIDRHERVVSFTSDGTNVDLKLSHGEEIIIQNNTFATLEPGWLVFT